MSGSYDFIIVGGGTAGCLIASRLASTASRPSVLLLEAGEHNDDAYQYRKTYDKFGLVFTQPKLDYGYISTSQANLKGRKVAQSRGRGLGGSSQVNFQIWSLGARDEFDYWASTVGDQDWGFESVLRKVKQIECLHYDDPSQKYISIVNPKPENHGYNGSVDVSIGPHFERELSHMFAAGQELGHKINRDINSGDPIGFGLPPHTSWKGQRTTSASAFINGKELKNLTILTNTRVVRVVVAGGRATGVKLENGEQLTATREVLLTSGAVDSPRLLLLSGIGPRADLENLGIPVASDVPGVGQSLTDHPTVFLTFHMGHGFSDRLTFGADLDDVAIASEQFLRDGTGPLSEHYSSVPTAFMKSEKSYSSAEFDSLPLESRELFKKPTVPSYEFALAGPLLPPTYRFEDKEDGYFNFFVALQNSQSRGTLRLGSRDPAELPLINPDYLGHEYDLLVLIDGVREAMKYVQTPTMKKYYKSAIHAPVSSSDEDIINFLRDNAAGLWHLSGSVKMGKREDQGSVVGSDLKVHGYENLRVADMSVTPILPSGHTQIVAYVIGETAAEKIIKEYSL